ncbi:hypothetical protein THAOC_19836 [Thalassiosira oceanica]|uniref:Uncharacterized protein n=1 Tax=Thalassiosira oceanica TaxID=159749 RepID=K0S3Q9_THAOC|nr:hypothetical protein THAOC_19836 [Thalassiosira oceanica]|eukprot:EJK59890.1 hypothetical protein THAOC_19836 [Thalassiosira oceanica]
MCAGPRRPTISDIESPRLDGVQKIRRQGLKPPESGDLSPPTRVDEDGFLRCRLSVGTILAVEVGIVRTVVAQLGKERPQLARKENLSVGGSAAVSSGTAAPPLGISSESECSPHWRERGRWNEWTVVWIEFMSRPSGSTAIFRWQSARTMSDEARAPERRGKTRGK